MPPSRAESGIRAYNRCTPPGCQERSLHLMLADQNDTLPESWLEVGGPRAQTTTNIIGGKTMAASQKKHGEDRVRTPAPFISEAI